MAHFKVQFIEEKICYDIHATRHLCLMDHIRRARVSEPLFLSKEIYYLISHKSSDIVVTLILYSSLFIQRELRSFIFFLFAVKHNFSIDFLFSAQNFKSIQVKLHDTHLLYSTMSGRHMWSDGTWSICTLPVMCAANSSASCGGDRKDCINFFSMFNIVLSIHESLPYSVGFHLECVRLLGRKILHIVRQCRDGCGRKDERAENRKGKSLGCEHLRLSGKRKTRKVGQFARTRAARHRNGCCALTCVCLTLCDGEIN